MAHVHRKTPGNFCRCSLSPGEPFLRHPTCPPWSSHNSPRCSMSEEETPFSTAVTGSGRIKSDRRVTTRADTGMNPTTPERRTSRQGPTVREAGSLAIFVQFFEGCTRLVQSLNGSERDWRTTGNQANRLKALGRRRRSISDAWIWTDTASPRARSGRDGRPVAPSDRLHRCTIPAGFAVARSTAGCGGVRYRVTQRLANAGTDL